MKSYYFLDNKGKQIGPIRVSLLKSHGVIASTYVWTEGMTAWMKASEVPELRTMFPIISPLPSPPSPPLYKAVPTSTDDVQCPKCKSYLTSKQIGKITFRYILIIGAGVIGSILTPVVGFLASREVYQATANWDNWYCISCKRSFRK